MQRIYFYTDRKRKHKKLWYLASKKPQNKMKQKWVPLWHSQLRIRHWLRDCFGAGSIPGLGTSACWGCGQKTKQKMHPKPKKPGKVKIDRENIVIKRMIYICIRHRVHIILLLVFYGVLGTNPSHQVGSSVFVSERS